MQLEKIDPEKLLAATVISTDQIKQNILDSSQYNLAPIDSLLRDEQGDRVVAVVGGGPTLCEYINNLSAYEVILIAGSAHDYVVSNFKPGEHQKVYCLVCDPDPIMCDYLTQKKDYITYLVASQCDKSMFLHLSDMPNRHIWDASADEEFNKVFREGAKLITGGCTIGTRAIGMAMAMGFKRMHLYGMDSCLSLQYKHHAYDFVKPDYETLGTITDIKIGEDPDAPNFRVAGYMLKQIFDFQYIIGTYADKLDLTVFGNGAIAYMMKVAKERAVKYIEEQRKVA